MGLSMGAIFDPHPRTSCRCRPSGRQTASPAAGLREAGRGLAKSLSAQRVSDLTQLSCTSDAPHRPTVAKGRPSL